MKKILLGAAGAAVLALTSQAQAATVVYNLTDDHCTGTCGGLASYGTVSVTGSGTTSMSFSVDLASGVFFNPNGNGLDTFSWDLVNNPLIAISGVTSGFAATTPQSAGSNHEDGFGNWDYIVNITSSSSTLQHLAFTVAGTGANAGATLTLDHNFVDNQNIFAAVDVIGKNGNTGVIGATLAGGVPEPATWGMMLVGFGGLGAMMRRRRAMTAVATA